MMQTHGPAQRFLRWLHHAALALRVPGLWLLATCLIHAQDDNGYAPPPPPDSAPPMQGDDQGPYAPPAPADVPGQAPQAPNPSPDDATGPVTDGSANFQTFYDSLANQGNWIQTDDYGYVWQPNVNDPNWAPYTNGHWVYTDDGWTWASDEPWGWATYHYGRWVNLDGTGWVWVPGYTWAPAWVSWRYGDGYVGWAPLPPDSFAGIDYFGDGYDASFGFHIGGDCDDYYGIGPAIYIFLPIGCVGYHDYHHWYHNRCDNWGLINHTTNVTNINVHRGGGPGAGTKGTFRHVTTGGPQVAQVDAASQMPVPRARLVHSGRPGPATLNGNTLSVYAPHVTSSALNARPAQVSGTLGATTINRGTDITRPPAVNARLAPAPATEAQIAAARDAVSRSPASAKVLTDAGNVTPVFRGPLTSLKPVSSPAIGVTSRAGTFAPGGVYNTPNGRPVFGPVHSPSVMNGGETPSEREAREAQQAGSQRIYSPTPAYPPRSYVPGGSGGAAPSESRIYTHSSSPAIFTPAPAAHSAPSSGSAGGSSGGSHSGGYGGGGSGGGGYSGGSHGAGGGSSGGSGGGGYSGGGGGYSGGGHGGGGGGSGGGGGGRGH